jgi:hypothetical protein
MVQATARDVDEHESWQRTRTASSRVSFAQNSLHFIFGPPFISSGAVRTTFVGNVGHHIVAIMDKRTKQAHSACAEEGIKNVNDSLMIVE